MRTTTFLRRLGLSPLQIGMALGWIACGLLVTEALNRGGLRGIVFAGLFLCGTLTAGIRFQELNERCDRYERALRQHGVDPARVYP